MYLERSTTRPAPELRIDGREFDVDFFGMDDGKSTDPDHARRLLFQLGAGYMIYLYVVQAGGTSKLDWFAHTFWTKDCAVAEVEMEEHGPPRRVEAEELRLPLLYSEVELGPEGTPPRKFRVHGMTFSARSEGPDVHRLRFTCELEAEGAKARLSWRNGEGWALEVDGAPSLPLGVRGHLAFGAPPA